MDDLGCTSLYEETVDAYRQADKGPRDDGEAHVFRKVRYIVLFFRFMIVVVPFMFISPAPPSALSTFSSFRDRGRNRAGCRYPGRRDQSAAISDRHAGGFLGCDMNLDAAVGIEFVANVLTSSPPFHFGNSKLTLKRKPLTADSTSKPDELQPFALGIFSQRTVQRGHVACAQFQCHCKMQRIPGTQAVPMLLGHVRRLSECSTTNRNKT